jgi:hypothetical protein
MAVPLRPDRLRRVAQVDRVDNRALLPTVIRGRIAVREWAPTWPSVLEPGAADTQLIDVERQESDCAGILDARDQASDLHVVAARDQVDRLLIVERLDRLGEPDRDVVGADDPLQAFRDR